MKKNNQSVTMVNRMLTAILPFAIALLGSCGGDPTPQPSAEEQQIEMLSAQWVATEVIYADDDITGEFTGFALTIRKDKTYTAVGSLSSFDVKPFKTSGSWEFKAGDLHVITRNDGVEMSLTVTETSLTLSFTMAEANGRVAGLGVYKFKFQKND